MADAQYPRNQLDALPLVDTSAAVGPTTITRVGNSTIKYWSAAAVGIQSVVATILAPPALTWYIIGDNFLDLRGCNHFTALLTKHVLSAVGDVGATMALRAEARGVGGVVNPPSQYLNNPGTIALCGFQDPNLSAGAYPFSHFSAQGFTITSDLPSANAPGSTGGAVVGTDFRFVLTGNATGGGNDLRWSLELWGQGP